MSERSSLLGRLWRKLKLPPAASAKAKEAVPAPANTASASPTPGTPTRRSRVSSIESLEGRIAPATVIPGGKGISYTDVDGDLVTITFSKALFTGTGAGADIELNNVFNFSAGKAHTGAANPTDDVPQQLRVMDLTRVFTQNGRNPADGVSIEIKVDQAGAGDGLTNVGAIKATLMTLGNVSVEGDLGQIDTGRDSALVGLKSLTVDSLGKLTNTQLGTPTYESTIIGKLGSFTAREVSGGYLHVIDGFGTTGTPAVAKGHIGSIVVTEKIQARVLTTQTANDGLIKADGNIGSIVVGSNRAHAANEPADGLVGGAGNDSGGIIAGGRIGSVLIKGDLTGGGGVNSGVLSAGKDIGRLEVRGFVLGGEGDFSGGVSVGGNIEVLKISHLVNSAALSGITGGAGTNSGVVATEGSILSAVVDGNIAGIALLDANADGNGSHAGGISAGAALKSLTLNGSVVGGVGANFSGFIEAGRSIGTLSITGNVVGGDGANSAVVVSDGGAGNINIAGYIAGGEGVSSGGLVVGHGYEPGIGAVPKLASLTIQDGIIGGEGDGSGFVNASSITSARVTLQPASVGRAALQGGGGDGSGAIRVEFSSGSYFLGGAIAGGEGDRSGQLELHGLTKSVTVGNIDGAVGKFSGAIIGSDIAQDGRFVGASVGTLKVGNITGGDGLLSGRVEFSSQVNSFTAGNLVRGAGELSGLIRVGMGAEGVGIVTSLKIGNIGAAGALGGTIQVASVIGSLTAGDLFGASVSAGGIGSFVANSVTQSTITAEGGLGPTGATTDVAIRSINVTHDVNASLFLAGYDWDRTPINGHAQIGNVNVGGDWIASSIAAGVRDVDMDGFGDADDVKIAANDGSTVVSKIASIVIKGDVLGTTATGDHFGFVAQRIGAITVGGQSFVASAAGTDLTGGTTMDVTARTVA